MQCENSLNDCLYPADCQFPSGPCPSVVARQYSNGRCLGVTPYATPTPALPGRTNMHRAITHLVETIYKMSGATCVEAVKHIREHYVGDMRLTSMAIRCAWCQRPMGTKEGDGAVGETSTICPDCFRTQSMGLMAENISGKTYDVRVTEMVVIKDQVEENNCIKDEILKLAAQENYPEYARFAAMLTGIHNVIAESDDKRDAAAIENAALI